MLVFSGSYSANDVHILLKPITIKNTPLVEKERLIQQQKCHYSEMITYESLPSKTYLACFQQLLAQNHLRFTTDLITLAFKINHRKPNGITLISLARAGIPIGILLKRILEKYFNRICHHYCLSIIRDHGLDVNALRYIIQQHPNLDSFTFVDGWTGKGVITQELDKSVNKFNSENQTQINSDLYVLNDIAGVAAVTASFDDYLIPSSLLNSTISGLISRSILNKDYLNSNDFHGCLYYQQFLNDDLSNWFIDKTMVIVDKIIEITKKIISHQNDNGNKQDVNQQSINFIKKIKHDYHINDSNLIKPGIGEATRVLLRRVPDKLILKNLTASQTQHLLLLAKEKPVTIIENIIMPYQAVSIIKDINHD